ncbi:type 1 glutamine amidotransferase [Anoxynatronum sibiricum]|uniref:Gamma-glutamyl-gamma-aminobutyrate hydrolase family protein n=1 Tax=Anoxynatronum sibiricum TaxID=210623 RepID=A0ABU9VTF9_9CLOT
MVLVLNFFLDDVFAATFDRVICSQLEETGEPVHFLRVRGEKEVTELLEDLSPFSHLILSGSEASPMEDYGWETPMAAVLAHCQEHRKPVLGICYGHQLLVRLLAGKEYLRVAPKPEFGWANIQLPANPLFEGLEDPVFVLSHYDEALALPEDFQLLAVSERCPVHAFQYGELPIWGVQFHPEYDLASSQEIFDVLKTKDPHFKESFIDQLEDEQRFRQNRRLFVNFINQ